MTILAIDTTTEICSVALWKDGLLGESLSDSGPQASTIVLKMLDELFQSCNTGWDDINMLAFAHGPGSFTGVRVTTGLVQGIALGQNLPVIGISTLASVAYDAIQATDQASSILVVQDARMGELYWGCYRLNTNGILECLSPDTVSSCALVNVHSVEGPWLVAGNGCQILKENCSEYLGLNENTELVWQPNAIPRSGHIAGLAEQALANGLKPTSAVNVKPVYIRDKVTH